MLNTPVPHNIPEKKDRTPIAFEDYLKIMRSKMHWLEGFAGAIQNKQLDTCVSGIRNLLNRLEASYEEKEPLHVS